MTHCPTCNNTRRIRIGNKHVECPMCKVTPPLLIDMELRVESVKANFLHVPTQVTLAGVDISTVLDQITPEQVINHYGHERLLDVMDGWQIREYMKPKDY